MRKSQGRIEEILVTALTAPLFPQSGVLKQQLESLAQPDLASTMSSCADTGMCHGSSEGCSSTPFGPVSVRGSSLKTHGVPLSAKGAIASSSTISTSTVYLSRGPQLLDIAAGNLSHSELPKELRAGGEVDNECIAARLLAKRARQEA